MDQGNLDRIAPGKNPKLIVSQATVEEADVIIRTRRSKTLGTTSRSTGIKNFDPTGLFHFALQLLKPGK